MDVWKTILVLLRRWYVAVPVLLLSLGSAAAIYASVPVRYESQGVAVLTPPVAGPGISAGAAQGATNPMLSFNTSLEVAASVITQSLNTDAYLKELVGPDGKDSIEISNKSGFITVTAESTAAARAQLLVTTMLTRVDEELITRQSALGAPPSTFIIANPVVAPTEPTPRIGSKVRAVGVAMILGLAASLGSAYLVESILEARRSRGVQQSAARPTMVYPLRKQPSGPAQPGPIRDHHRPG